MSEQCPRCGSDSGQLREYDYGIFNVVIWFCFRCHEEWPLDYVQDFAAESERLALVPEHSE